MEPESDQMLELDEPAIEIVEERLGEPAARSRSHVEVLEAAELVQVVVQASAKAFRHSLEFSQYSQCQIIQWMQSGSSSKLLEFFFLETAKLLSGVRP